MNRDGEINEDDIDEKEKFVAKLPLPTVELYEHSLNRVIKEMKKE